MRAVIADFVFRDRGTVRTPKEQAVPTVAIIDGVEIQFYPMSIRRRISTRYLPSSSPKFELIHPRFCGVL